jgi:hypothetical protein
VQKLLSRLAVLPALRGVLVCKAGRATPTAGYERGGSFRSESSDFGRTSEGIRSGPSFDVLAPVDYAASYFDELGTGSRKPMTLQRTGRQSKMIGDLLLCEVGGAGRTTLLSGARFGE